MRGIKKEKKKSSANARPAAANTMPGYDVEDTAPSSTGKRVKGAKHKATNKGDGEGIASGDDIDSVFKINSSDVSAIDATAIRQTVSESMSGLLNQKPSIRMNAAEALLKLMRGATGRSACECIQVSYSDQILTIVSRLLARQVSNTTEEAPLLLDLTCLISLMLGGSQDAFFEKFQGPLKKIIEEESVGEEIQSQACFALGFISFISSQNEQTETWDFIEDILCDGPDQGFFLPVMQAARSWVLLAGVMDDENILVRSRERVFEGMSRLLSESESTEGRVTAGEGLAFLYEVANRNLSDVETAQEMSYIICNQPNMAVHTLKSLHAASTESSKKISKRDKKEQRAAFRAVEAWIFDGDTPDYTIQLQGASLEISSFQRMFLLEDLKRVLQNGFQSMLKIYDVVMDILDVHFLDDAVETRQRVEKGSKEDKRRDVIRKQERAYAEESEAWYTSD